MAGWARRGAPVGPQDPGSENGRVGPGERVQDWLWIQLLGNSPAERPVWKRQGTISRARKQTTSLPGTATGTLCTGTVWNTPRLRAHSQALEGVDGICTCSRGFVHVHR